MDPHSSPLGKGGYEGGKAKASEGDSPRMSENYYVLSKHHGFIVIYVE